MKTGLHGIFTSDEKGVAVFVTLILLFIVTIAGVTILFVAGRDRIASSDMSSVRGVAEAANTALDACENQISEKSPLMLSVLNKYLQDKSYRWFFSTDSLGAKEEKKVSAGNGYTYSAEIMAYDTANNVLQVRGIGYGRSNEQKHTVAQYRLTGLQKVSSTVIPQYAIYLAGNGRNFDQTIDVTGNVFVGTDFHINNAHNCRIRGFLKTGYNTALTSGSNGQNFIIDSGAYIGTALKLNSNSEVTCGGKLGIEGNLDLSSLLTVKGDGWFNGVFNGGTSNIDMSNKTIHYSNGSLLMSRVVNKIEDKKAVTIPDIPQQIGIGNTNDSAWGLDTTGLYAKASTLSGSFTAESLNLLYKNCTVDKKINGYMVLHDNSGEFSLGNSTEKFKGKVILLIKKNFNINGNFFNMEDTARILMIVTGNAEINGLVAFNSGSSFNGLIYLRNTALLKLRNNGTYTINGAVHLAEATCKWQLDNGSTPQVLNFRFNTSIINEFVSMGIITIPTPGGLHPSGSSGTIRLVDFKIRPELLSVAY